MDFSRLHSGSLRFPQKSIGNQGCGPLCSQLTEVKHVKFETSVKIRETNNVIIGESGSGDAASSAFSTSINAPNSSITVICSNTNNPNELLEKLNIHVAGHERIKQTTTVTTTSNPDHVNISGNGDEITVVEETILDGKEDLTAVIEGNYSQDNVREAVGKVWTDEHNTVHITFVLIATKAIRLYGPRCVKTFNKVVVTIWACCFLAVILYVILYYVLLDEAP